MEVARLLCYGNCLAVLESAGGYHGKGGGGDKGQRRNNSHTITPGSRNVDELSDPQTNKSERKGGRTECEAALGRTRE